MASSFRLSLLLCLLAATLQAASDPDPIAKYEKDAGRLIDAAMADSEGYNRLQYLCDRIGNRVSGSASLEKAISWSAEQMRKAGLENVRTMPVKVPKWVRGEESAAIVEPVSKPLHMLGLGMSVGTPAGGVTAETVVVSNFDELAKLGKKVNGKIVVYNERYEGYGRSVLYRISGASRAAAMGAVAVLVRSITPLALQEPHTGTLLYSPSVPKIPAAAISIEDATMLARLQASGSPARVHLQMAAKQLPDADSANVIGELRGSEKPEEVVVLGGHIDSWDVGQGAQDDGAGIIATMQAVVLIKKLGLHPRRTVRVVFWVNEENGGRGGDAYRASLGDQVNQHVAAIEMDEGAERPTGFGYSMGGGRRRRQSATPARTGEQLASYKLCQRIAQLLKPIDATRVDEEGGGSDIAPLAADGVPALSPSPIAEHYFDWHHTQADTFDKINLEDFRKNIATVAVLSYVLADMPGRLAGQRSEPASN